MSENTEHKNQHEEQNQHEENSQWNRREWIQMVGASTIGLSALGLNKAFSQIGSEDVWVKDNTLFIKREKYASLFGPTTGDMVRLADTELFIRIEKDYQTYGEENKFGGGKTVRDGMGQSVSASDKEALDMCLLGCTIVDHWGIVKADIGIKDGKIAAIGKAGNPDVQDGVSAHMIIGPNTEVHGCWGNIVTAGGIDTHIHFICPQIVETALYSGITTMIGGGTGPNDGTNATTVTPGKFFIEKMLRASEALPVNLGYYGKGNVSNEAAQIEMLKAGALGVKIHEDWGSTPSVIDYALRVADKYDTQVTIHTDTLNEAGYLESTLKAINNRVIHTFHTEGAGGGHAPDIIKIAMYPHVLPSSTNPTKPYTVNTIAEHLDMLMVCHHLSPRIKEDVAFADSRIRPSTIAAEDVLHDMGVLSMMSSDSQAMGRVGEVIIRTWQTAHKMKLQRGALAEDKLKDDNYRVKRFISKYTINPAKAHGIDEYVGSIEAGKIADLVVWKPENFGVKPEMIYKSGMVIAAKMGDANASIPTPQPVLYRNMFGAYGDALSDVCFNFVSKASIDSNNISKLKLKRNSLPVKGCRSVYKKDMVHNSAMPHIEVNPETYAVMADGKLLTCEPLKELPMAQRYFLF